MRNRSLETQLSIGQLAKRAGVRVDTVRYYERRGLLPAADRLPSGYRTYSVESSRRLGFVRHAQELGFTLDEIRELLTLRVDRRRSCADVRELAVAKLAAIDAKLESLRQIRRALAKLAESCTGRGPTSVCPLLEALDQQNPGGER
jgi:Hg(II)-responsive transcriptional regulator